MGIPLPLCRANRQCSCWYLRLRSTYSHIRELVYCFHQLTGKIFIAKQLARNFAGRKRFLRATPAHIMGRLCREGKVGRHSGLWNSSPWPVGWFARWHCSEQLQAGGERTVNKGNAIAELAARITGRNFDGWIKRGAALGRAPPRARAHQFLFSMATLLKAACAKVKRTVTPSRTFETNGGRKQARQTPVGQRTLG